MTYGAATDKGRRYDHNEDFFFLPGPEKTEGNGNQNIGEQLFLLCDGIGGQNAGEVASRTACEWISESFYRNPDTELTAIIIETNRRLRELAASNSEYDGMGTTLAAALFGKDSVSFFTLGDSRIYRLRNNQLEQLSEDQSLVWEMYRKGLLKKDDLRFQTYNNIITCALGTEDSLRSDQINRGSSRLYTGDRYLMCSDGISDMMPDTDIAESMRASISAADKAAALVRHANKKGGRDNSTAIVIEI